MYAWKMVVRNKRITVSVIAAVAALTFFLSVYTSSIQASQDQLDRVYRITEVTARISGQNGGATAKLNADTYNRILSSGFVKESHALIQQDARDDKMLRAMDITELDADLSGWIPYATWLDGYDPSFLCGDELVCLAPLATGVAVGETVSLSLDGAEKTLTLELKVIGLYGKKYHSSNDSDIYYCPLKAMEAFLQRQGEPIAYNFVEMDLKNLQNLGKFKKEMTELGLSKGASLLSINDALLQHVTAKFRQHIRLLTMLLPILLTVVGGIGFGLSFLLLRGRKKEVAILRSLGTGRRRVFGMLLSESAIQVVLGTLLGGGLALVVIGSTAFRLQYLALITASFLVGGAVVMWQMVNKNVFTMMAGE